MFGLLLAQMWNDQGDHMDGNGWGRGVIFGLVVLALIVVLVVFLIRHFSSSGGRGGGGGTRSAQDILAERFARGEIDEDVYRKRQATLRD